MSILKVTTVGNSVGVILPKEILERLRVGKGDSLYVIETKQGIELTAYNPEFAAQVEVAERVMREDLDALKKLAEQLRWLRLSGFSRRRSEPFTTAKSRSTVAVKACGMKDYFRPRCRAPKTS